LRNADAKEFKGGEDQHSRLVQETEHDYVALARSLAAQDPTALVAFALVRCSALAESAGPVRSTLAESAGPPSGLAWGRGCPLGPVRAGGRGR
jgi:hypothetical protein